MSGNSSCSRQRAASWGFAITLVLAMALAFGIGAPVKAFAVDKGGSLIVAQASDASILESFELAQKNLWEGDTSNTYLESYFEDPDYGLFDDVKLTKVTSSDSAVLKVAGSGTSVYDYSILPKKVGTATLSVTFKVNGKKYTTKQTYTVSKFDTGMKSLSINGKSVALPSAKNPASEGYYYQFTGTKAKVKVTTVEGCKLLRPIVRYYGGNSKATKAALKSVKIHLKKVESGKAFTIPIPAKATATVMVKAKNTEGKTFFYHLHIVRTPPFELVGSNDSDSGVMPLYVKHPKTQRVEYYGGHGAIISKISGFKTVSVKSSKSSVIKVTKKSDPRKITLQAKKAGKATITVKYRWKGRVYTTSAKYTALTYPIKSLVVNGKKLNLTKNPRSYTFKKYAKSSATIKVNAAKGWKLISIQFNGKKTKNGSTAKLAKSKVNGATIALKKGSYTYYYNVDFTK